jgi:hypothetical protein
VPKPTEARSSNSLNKQIKISQRHLLALTLRHLLARKTPSIGKKLQLSSLMLASLAGCKVPVGMQKIIN